MTKTNISQVVNKENLLVILSTFDISVPPLGMGRTKDHVERWSICKLLSTLAYQNRLSYPLHLTHADRPDFILSMEDTNIGIECTEARNQNHAKYQAIVNLEFPEKIYSASLFQQEQASLTKNEMYDDLKQNALTGKPLMGDQPEKDWAQYIKHAIQKKLLALAKPEFEKFNKNYLLIYAATPFGQVDIDIAMEHLNAYLS